MQHAVSGMAPEPMSAGKRAWGVYDIFTTSDGMGLFVGVVTERQWEIFTTALGEPELLDPAYATNNLRSKARETLIPLVAKLLARRPISELEGLCEKAGLPAGAWREGHLQVSTYQVESFHETEVHPT